MTSNRKPPRPQIGFIHGPTEPTLAIKLPEPSVDQMPKLPQTPSDAIEKMRAKAATWKVIHSGSVGIIVKEVPLGSGTCRYVASGSQLILTGDPADEVIPTEFNYRTMPKTMSGFWPLKIASQNLPEKHAEDAKFYYFTTRTKGVYYLLYNIPMEELYESQSFMSTGIDLKNMDRIADDKGKRLQISRLSLPEFKSLLTLAATSQGRDSLELKDSTAFLQWEALKKKLNEISDLKVLSEGFNMRQFVNGVMFAFPQKDDSGSSYSITSGETQDDYRLYVNQAVAGTPPGCLLVATFRYNKDHCVLFKEG